MLWGSDALWTGAPQWQIEGLRRLEIPEDMQKKYGFTPLGPADGPVKTAIFSGNSARLYGLQKQAELGRHDRFAALKADYVANGPGAQQPALRLRCKTGVDRSRRLGSARRSAPARRIDNPSLRRLDLRRARVP